MASHSQFPISVMETRPATHFAIKPQSPTGHLMALRRPDNDYRNTDFFLSPGLHNISDTWVRHLRSKSLQFVNEFGQGRNQHLLLHKSVQERIAIRNWSDHVKCYARTFTLGLYDDALAKRQRALFEAQHPFTPTSGAQPVKEVQAHDNGADQAHENEAPHQNLHRSVSSSSFSTSPSTPCESVFDGDDDNSSSDQDKNGTWDEEMFDDADISLLVEHNKDESACNEGSAQLLEGSSKALACSASARQIELQNKETARQERISMAEERLASAWHHWSGFGYVTQCSWLLVPSQTPKHVTNALALQSRVPFIQVTTPQGVACNLMELPSRLPEDHFEHVTERNAGQPSMALYVKKYRRLYETHGEYIRRLDAEKWWAEREEQTKMEMEEEAKNKMAEGEIEEMDL